MTLLERDNIIDQARYDTVKAAERARRIRSPLYRAQALAWVGWMSSDSPVAVKLILDSAASVRKVSDPFDRVTTSSWPIRALIERGKGSLALPAIVDALAAAEAIENPTSKADALFMVWQAAAPLGAGLPDKITSALCKSCLNGGQKGHQHLRDAALMLGETQPERAQLVIASIPEGRYKRQAEQRFADRQFMYPRAFFWRKSDKD